MPRYTPISGSRNTLSGNDRKGCRIDGIKELAAQFEQVIDATSARGMKRNNYEAGEILANQIRRNAPYDPERKQGTHLRDAVFCDEGANDKPDVLVGVRMGKYFDNAAPHAWIIEFGAQDRPPQSYMRTGINQAGSAVADKVQSGYLQAIQKAKK